MRARLHDEHGVALVVAIMALMLLLMIGGVALTQALQTDQSSVRDESSKGAIQAADAGLNVAMFRASKSLSAACTDASGAATTPTTINGIDWCPAVTEQLDNVRSYTYRVTANTIGDRTVVSSGQSGGVTRRIRSTIKRTGVPGISMGVTALNSITMSGGSAVFNDPNGVNPTGPYGDVGTNGNFNVSGTAQIQFRNVLLGPSGTVSAGVSAARQISVPDFNLPLPDFEVPENVNDNNLVPAGAWWDPVTRNMNISGQTVVLDTGIYDFCRIRISGGGLYARPGAHVQIYLDSPDRNASSSNPQSSCSTASGFGTTNVSGSGSIQACSAISGSTCTTGNPADLLITMYGRPSAGKDAVVSGGAAKTAVFYAPRSNFDLSGSGKTIGSIAVSTANFSGGSQIWYDERATGAGFGNYTRSTWLECRPAAPTSDPGSGC